MNYLIHLFFILIIILLLVFVYIGQYKCKKLSKELVKTLSKDLDFLTNLYRKQEITHLKNTIKLYSQFQIILKISKADYVSFFKYDYSKRYVVLHFLLSIDNRGVIIQDSMLDDLPVASNLIILDLMKSDDWDLYPIVIEDLKENNDSIYKAMISRGVNKFYYQNLFKDKNNTLGFIAVSYKDKDFNLLEDDKDEILRIIEKMKYYL